MASRDTFLIDPTGKVAKFYDVTPDKLEGHSAELLADIEAFKAPRRAERRQRAGPGFRPGPACTRRICIEFVPPCTPDSSPLVRMMVIAHVHQPAAQQLVEDRLVHLRRVAVASHRTAPDRRRDTA